jgi:hypothetical protein
MKKRSAFRFTDYFLYTRNRPDRANIDMEWIRRAVEEPLKEVVQTDGRIRRWAWVEEEGRYLRVILLEDGQTIHNAFFDRGFKET